MRKMAKILICICLLLVLLAGCGKEAPIPTTETTEPPVESVTLVVTADTIGQLEDYPALKQADLRGSTCYDAIESYMRSHPQVEVTYTVDLGGTAVEPGTEALVLQTGEYDYDTLASNLSYLKALGELRFENTELTASQLDALAEGRENLNITYSVSLLGQQIDSDAERLDLSALQPEELEGAMHALAMLPNVREVELMTEEGSSSLSVEQVGQLQSARPEAVFHYTFQLFGKTVSTTDEQVEYRAVNIGDAGEETLRQALDIMKGCTYLKLESCYMSNEVLAQLREDYRDRMQIVWRVYFGKSGSCLTDRKVIRYVYGLDDSNCKQLKYCEGAEFIDFGHDDYLRDCSFVAGMPNLRAIILSGSSISDLSGFANCPNLEFLEIAYCGYVEDISPLAACTNLKMLNTGFTKVKDFSALDGIALETLSAPGNVPQEEQDRFVAAHPECRVLFTGSQPYGYPWRYEKDGSPTAYYALLKEKFGYPNPGQTNW